MKLTKKQRAEVRSICNGRCAYCGTDLPEKGWHADHVDPVQRRTFYRVVNGQWKPWKVTMLRPERDTVENILPSCRSCNLYKSSMSLESFRKLLRRQVTLARKYSKNFVRAELFGLVTVNKQPIIFYFERLNGLEAAAPGAEPVVITQLDGESLCV